MTYLGGKNHCFVRKFVEIIDEVAGFKRFKNGVELSGGEWQKIAIARAYMQRLHQDDLVGHVLGQEAVVVKSLTAFRSDSRVRKSSLYQVAFMMLRQSRASLSARSWP